ncbi:polymeric immunoglobulin receptor-like isoform X2 [Genypterus blacodes]|uniref:polymeric immunoglobulin receptor-like isoform X2 n=1 Tax=Genypterus blacodes TaxID=154954 RepID=UPI003F75C275
MWNQPLLFILCTLSCFTGAEAIIRATGYHGGEAIFVCPYPEGYEGSQKYLCNSQCRYDNDVLITTDKAQSGRYLILDNRAKHVFTVTIADLDDADAGKYWCGVTQSGKDLYSKAKLDVLPDSCCDTFSQFEGVTDASASISCPHDQYRNTLKYICRGTQPSVCLRQALVTSIQSGNRRFTLNDKAWNEFIVTFTQLTLLDSGPYLCGVQSLTGFDHFSLVQLSVKEWCCVTLNNLIGTVGRPLQMQCPYPPQHKGKLKFLCKGDRHYNCNKVVTSGRSNSRFKLQDSVTSSSFSVRITELRAEDAGMFWCGSDTEWSPGNYVKIQLSVVSQQTTSIYSTVTPEAEHLRPVIFAASAVLAVLLSVAGTLVVVYKRRSRKTQGAVVKVNSGNKEKATDSGKGKDAEDIYANANVDGWDLYHGDDADNHGDSLYQNFSTEGVSCHETVA